MPYVSGSRTLADLSGKKAALALKLSESLFAWERFIIDFWFKAAVLDGERYEKVLKPDAAKDEWHQGIKRGAACAPCRKEGESNDDQFQSQIPKPRKFIL